MSQTFPISKICKKTKVDVRTIYLIKNNKIWKNISCYFSFDNDGFINDENLDKIIQMVHEGKSNSTILYSIGCPYIQYFSKIIDEIRFSINEKNDMSSTTRESYTSTLSEMIK